MAFDVGQVYQSQDFPDHVWLVVEVGEAIMRVVFLSVREEMRRFGYEPGSQMEITLTDAGNSKCVRIA